MTTPLTLPGRPEVEYEEVTRRMPMYHLILLDDDAHTYEYVIVMLLQLFGYQHEKGYQMAKEVDKTGRCIVLTAPLERVEFKRDQIHAFGADPLSAKSAGSMSAVIEQAAS